MAGGASVGFFADLSRYALAVPVYFMISGHFMRKPPITAHRIELSGDSMRK